MPDFLRRDKQPKSEMFGQLTIEKRVLITPKSTISIPNIAVISSGTIKVPRRLVWALARSPGRRDRRDRVRRSHATAPPK